MQRELVGLLSDGGEHSGNDLAARLKVTRAAIWKHIRQLRHLGIEVQARRGQGYSLPAPVELLDAQRILSGMPQDSRELVDELRVHWVTDSTSDELLRTKRTVRGHARVCLAEYQQGGRGRRGRRWFAAIGKGVCVSIGWCFPVSPASLSCLGLAAGVGVLRAVRACGASGVNLKWPNDLVADGRKLAGILVDVQGEAGGPLHAVIGVGLNFASDQQIEQEIIGAGGIGPANLRETIVAGLVSRNQVAAEMITSLIRVLQQFEHTGFDALYQEWCDADYLHGKSVQIIAGNIPEIGIASGITSDGQLLVDINGSMRQFLTGDVTVRAMS